MSRLKNETGHSRIIRFEEPGLAIEVKGSTVGTAIGEGIRFPGVDKTHYSLLATALTMDLNRNQAIIRKLEKKTRNVTSGVSDWSTALGATEIIEIFIHRFQNQATTTTGVLKTE